MLLKITFAFFCVVLLYQPTTSSPVDGNAIADLVLLKYFSIVKASGTALCCAPYNFAAYSYS